MTRKYRRRRRKDIEVNIVERRNWVKGAFYKSPKTETFYDKIKFVGGIFIEEIFQKQIDEMTGKMETDREACMRVYAERRDLRQIFKKGKFKSIVTYELSGDRIKIFFVPN